MNKKNILIIGGVVAVIVVIAVIALVRSRSGSNQVFSVPDATDIHEGTSTSDLDAANAELEQRIQDNSWSKNIPYFADNYAIYFIDSKNVEVDISRSDLVKETQYKNEAKQWLVGQGMPSEVKITYKEVTLPSAQ